MIAHTKTAPGWVPQLEFAEQFHKLPWELYGGRPRLWYERWKVIRDISNEITQQQAEKNNG